MSKRILALLPDMAAAWLVVTLLLASSLRAEGSPSGEVGFGERQQMTNGPERTQEEVISLRNYRGKAMTAFQVTVICEWPYRLVGIGRGELIADSSAWRLFSELKPGKGTDAGADTARVVVLSKSLVGIGPTTDSGLLSVTVRRPTVASDVKAAQARLLLKEVIGALPTGDNAGLVTGPPLSLQREIP